MATPIKPTPTLHGEDADVFVEKMLTPPSKEKKEFFKKIKEECKDSNPFKDMK